jgi:hypothetical protein
MRKVWSLPEERRLDYTRPDWLLHLVDLVDDEERAKTLAAVMACLAFAE